MSAHTPGPWFFDDGQGGRYFPHVVVGGGNPDAAWYITVSTCRGRNGGETSELIANARLIAAAPELLEALERLCEQVRSGGELDTLQARAAIAKARGER